jgi:N-glycosylase/DNA lyase
VQGRVRGAPRVESGLKPEVIRVSPPFLLRESLKSGQAFRWREGTPPAYAGDSAGLQAQLVGHDAWLSGVVGGRLFLARQDGDRIQFHSSSPSGRKHLERYLSVASDKEAVRKAFVIDDFTETAFERYGGIRILRQDPWETMVCFMISATNSVSNIERVVSRLCDWYGRRIKVEEPWFQGSYRAFPTPQALARADEQEMRRATSMGFRAPFVIAAARRIVEEETDLSEFRTRPYVETIEQLMSYDGIGEKIADCVALFSLDKPEAFTVDRWIKRVMERTYFRGRRQSYQKIKERAWRLWGKDAGYANQLMFHQARVEGIAR